MKRIKITRTLTPENAEKLRIVSFKQRKPESFILDKLIEQCLVE